MSGVSVDLIAQIDALQAQYIRALDNRDFQGWVDTFDTAEDTAYFCTPAENVDNNLEIALMYDD